MRNIKLNECFLGVFISILCQHAMAKNIEIQHPFYIGALGGIGATTWDGLVPSEENQNLALSLSTPIDSKEGGGVWGIFAGYEFLPYFGVETNYMKYPNATLVFDPISLFSFKNNEQTILLTHTETVNLMGKFMFYIPRTTVKLYSSLGAAGVHRKDLLVSNWHLSPTFGFGVNYNFTPRIMTELGANYTAGYGESQLNPTETYFPFLYSGFVRLAYRF